MSAVNVIFALKDTHFQRLKDNFILDENGDPIQQPPDLTMAQRKKLRNHYTGRWPAVTFGADTYHILQFALPEVYEDPQNPAAGHKWIEFLKNKWPNVWIVVGCWHKTKGPQSLYWGEHYESDGSGNLVIAGTPIYPRHAQYMRIMPPDVVRDENGDVISSTPAAAPKDVSLIYGFKPRRWD